MRANAAASMKIPALGHDGAGLPGRVGPGEGGRPRRSGRCADGGCRRGARPARDGPAPGGGSRRRGRAASNSPGVGLCLRLAGEHGEHRGQVLELVGDDMDDAALALHLAGDGDEAAPSTTGRNVSNIFGQTMMLAMSVSSSRVMKMTPLAVPGRWRTRTRPETVTRRPFGRSRSVCVVDDAARGELRAQERDRVRLQRQAEEAVVVDHMLAERHRRQGEVRLACGCRRARRRRTAAGGSARAPPPPRPRAAHSASRRSRPSERKASASASRSIAAARQAGAQPQVADRIVAAPARASTSAAGVLLAEALDLAEAEPDGMGRADVAGHRGVGRVEAGLRLEVSPRPEAPDPDALRRRHRTSVEMVPSRPPL